MNQVQNESTGTNTVLIVLLLAAVVAFGVWFFSQGTAPAVEDPGLNVDLNLPAAGGQQGTGAMDTQQQPAQ